MPESSEDPVAECVRQLQNNDQSLKNLALGDIIPEIYADGELDEDGDEVEYDGRFVDDDIVRIANALKTNTTVEDSTWKECATKSDKGAPLLSARQ